MYYQERTKGRCTREMREREIRNKLIKTIGCLFILAVIVGGINLIQKIVLADKPQVNNGQDAKVKRETRAAGEVSVSYTAKEPYIQQLEDLLNEEPQISTVLENQSEYPKALLEMLAANTETLQFVLDYPTKKDQPAAETVDENIVKGEIPLLIQWDGRWGYGQYGGKLLAVNGCGPTCIAMVAAGLSGRNDITPLTVAQYSYESGYLTEDNGTAWDLMSEGCQAYGLTGIMLGLDESAMINTLDNGMPIICSMGPGDFTQDGHFIILTGYNDGAFTVNDPNSKIRSSQKWSYEQIKDQINNMWYYYMM